MLARIINGLGLRGSRIGTFVMGCAAGADVLAWSLLTIVVVVAAHAGHGGFIWSFAGMLTFILAMVFVVRPAPRLLLRVGPVRRSGSAAIFPVIGTCLFMAAWATTRLGFHPIFGAFALGTALPRQEIMEAAPETPVLLGRGSLLLVPVFFVTARAGTAARDVANVHGQLLQRPDVRGGRERLLPSRRRKQR